MNYYVSADGPLLGDGSQDAPFRRIGQAAEAARPGDTVIVAPGIYRECVNPKNGGTSDRNRIVYRSQVPGAAVITGAEEIREWDHVRDDIWMTRIPNGFFSGYNPYTTQIEGDWYRGLGRINHTGQVYFNGQALYEEDCLDRLWNNEPLEWAWDKEYSRQHKWYTEQDGDITVIYARFPDGTPHGNRVEVNVRRRVFFPEQTGINHITVSGFTLKQAATQWAPPTAFQEGLIGPHWSLGWIIEDCEISNSKCCGISLGKYYDPENDHYFTNKHVKSPTQMERDAVCRGQYHGWLKEKVGSHIVRRCHIHHCEQAGIVGRMGCVFSLIEDNHIHHINNMQQLGGAEISGIKFHAAIDVVFRRNHIHHSTMGIWCDWQAQGTRITQNLLHDNHAPEGTPMAQGAMMSQDIFVEVGHGPTLIDNNVLLSKAALRIATEGVACVHNLILGAFTAVGGGTDNTVNGINQPRYTPYHIRHRTEVAGFMSILHGDDRMYNNIFIQNWPAAAAEEKEDMGFKTSDNREVGTHVFDDYPTYDEWIGWFEMDKPADMGALAKYHFSHLPVWVNGNAYFNGAKAWKNEKDNLVDDQNQVSVELVEEDGKYYLKTNVYDVMKAFKVGLIDSDLLGCAFEPEQRFENPDGTSILFDTDYLGEHRGVASIPGPFASAEAAAKLLWED